MPETIVITGVTKGLGRALAEAFHKLGHTVYGCGRSPDAIQSLADQLDTPGRFTAVDVTSAPAVQSWADHILAEAGPPDRLICNAAVINPRSTIWECPADTFDLIMDVNLKGVGNTVRAFVPAMIQRGTGVIITLSSGAGRMAIPQMGPYCASKWGIEGLTQTLAEELPQGLAAIPLSPGVVNTEMLQTSFGDSAHDYPTPDEWVQTAAAYMLELGPAQNGQSLTVPVVR